MNEDNPNNQLVPVEHRGLALTSLSDNRILSEMVGASLVLARESAFEPVDLDALVEEAKSLYRNKGGMAQENIRAFQLFLRAAKAGHPAAQMFVSNCYRLADGVEEDGMEAVRWLNKAANAGFVKALVMLGILYQSGFKHLPKDEEQAMKCYQKAASTGSKGAGAVCFLIASIYRDRKDFAQELKWYKEGALVVGSGGSLDCLCEVRKLYYEHGYQIGGDEAEAYAWFRLYSDNFSRPTHAAELAASMSSSGLVRAEQRYQELREQLQSRAQSK